MNYIPNDQHYKKTCMRLIFFNENVGKLPSDEGFSFDSLDKYQDAYIGFMVVRPLPHAYIGRSAFLPTIEERQNIHLIRPKEELHLFGKRLELKSLVFIQQDKSIGACSPTALWISLNGLKSQWDLGEIPAISEMTEMAGSHIELFNRSFPNMGLYIPQLELVIKELGLEPDFINPQSRDFYNPSEIIAAYTRAKIPVIIQIGLYEYTKEYSNSLVEKDGVDIPVKNPDIRHICVVSGVEIERDSTGDQTKSYFHLMKVKNLFIHDDRKGPYEHATLVKKIWKDGNHNPGYPFFLLDYTNKNYYEIERFWVLEGILIPNYPKIRISYDAIITVLINFTEAINSYRSPRKINALLDFAQTFKEAFIENAKVQFAKPKPENDEDRISLNWDVYLTQAGYFKEELINERNTKRPEEAIRFLLSSDLPRFIWIAQGFFINDEKVSIEIVFDATDIERPVSCYRVWIANNLEDRIRSIVDAFISTDSVIMNEFVARGGWKSRITEPSETRLSLTRTFFTNFSASIKRYQIFKDSIK